MSEYRLPPLGPGQQRQFIRAVRPTLTQLLPPLRDSMPAYRLRPLIYSMGPDGESGINAKSDEWPGADTWKAINPYDLDERVGEKQGEAAIDNLTNWLQEY